MVRFSGGDNGGRTDGCGRRTDGCGRRTDGCGHRTDGCGHRTDGRARRVGRFECGRGGRLQRWRR
ncbi:hypothetical protein FL583_26455 [Cryptosporangium phraense]|uniref:Uncharacterized protein n=1 Tax=Cryptosporangium phraense TaxID=2593070 RepID=A0A545ALG4_9ACTN|nr:hypothetical protein FL583_26455 [Cryptosporangium phraense]